MTGTGIVISAYDPPPQKKTLSTPAVMIGPKKKKTVLRKHARWVG